METVDNKKVSLCDRCGKDMVDDDDIEHVGLSVSNELPEDLDRKKFWIKQLGKYFKMKGFKMCIECWYDSMGVKVKGAE